MGCIPDFTPLLWWQGEETGQIALPGIPYTEEAVVALSHPPSQLVIKVCQAEGVA